MYGNYDDVCDYNSHYQSIENFAVSLEQACKDSQSDSQKSACQSGYNNASTANYCKSTYPNSDVEHAWCLIGRKQANC